MCVLNITRRGKMATLQQTSKTHATLKKKVFVPFYAEDLYFLNYENGMDGNKNLRTLHV